MQQQVVGLASNRRASPYMHCFVGALFVIGAFTYSSWLGSDVNWDLLNYHLYSGETALSWRAATDIAAAQRETYFFPGLDILFAGLRHAFWHEPYLLAGMMAIPEGIACYFVWRICLVCLPDTALYRPLVATVAVLFGATGAASLPTIGTTMSEMLPVCFFLAAITMILEAGLGTSRTHAASGSLLGIALALKLVLIYALVGTCLAVVTMQGTFLIGRLRNAICLCGCALLSYLTLTWWWLLRNERLFGNPLFPQFNDVFHSPWVAAARLTDDRFKPTTWFQALIGPLRWAHWQVDVTETPARDIRLSLASVAVISLLIIPILRKSVISKQPEAGRNAIFVSILTVTGFIVWQNTFSILRYLTAFELLAGVVIVAAPALWFPRWRYAPIATIAVATSLAGLTTIYPFWSDYGIGKNTQYWPAIDRFRGPGDAVQVQFPVLPSDAMIIELDRTPTGYLAAFAPQNIVFVGANNNIIRPGDREKLAHKAEVAIRTHQGPLWGVEQPDRGDPRADETLKYYGLQRAQNCVQIQSNLDQNRSRLCPLTKLAGVGSGYVQ